MPIRDIFSSKSKASLRGKVALITGGASGIGRALATELVHRGCAVVLVDRQIELAREAALTLGPAASALELDVRNVEAFREVAKTVIDKHGRIDFFFNNAGIAYGYEVADATAEDFDDVIDVNLRGVCYGILAVYPHMIRQRSGHIINTASVAGLVATAGASSYVATKHAVVALSKSLRIEGKVHDVHVSALCPGAIRTPILTGGKFGRIKMPGATGESVLRQWEKVRPMDPAKFAKEVIDRVLANDPIIVVPSWWKVMWMLDRISPSLAITIGSALHRRVREELKRGDAAEAAGFAPPYGTGSGTPSGEPKVKTNGHTNGTHARA